MHGDFLLVDAESSSEEKCPHCGFEDTIEYMWFENMGEMADEPQAIKCRKCKKIFRGGKMAKSGENFTTLKTLIENYYNPLDYRYFCLQAHYRKGLTFSWVALEAAKTGLRRLKERVLNLGEKEGVENKGYLKKFNDAIDDDLNMPLVLPGSYWRTERFRMPTNSPPSEKWIPSLALSWTSRLNLNSPLKSLNGYWSGMRRGRKRTGKRPMKSAGKSKLPANG
jgi:phage FluMu protein Com